MAMIQQTAAKKHRGLPWDLPLIHHTLYFAINTPRALVMAGREGDMVRVNVMNTPLIIINSMKLARELLVKQRHTTNKGPILEYSRSLLDTNPLITSHHDEFEPKRETIAGPFTPKAVENYLPDMVVCTRDLLESWGYHSIVNISGASVRTTLRIAARVLYHVDVKHDHRFYKNLSTVIECFTNEMLALVKWPRSIRTRNRKRLANSLKHLKGAFKEIINERRAIGDPGDDLLGALMESERKLTDEEIIDELITFAIAAHETSSTAASWAIYELARNHEVRRLAQAEVDKVLGTRTPDSSDLGQLPYLEAVVTETLRRYPPAPLIGRTADQDIEVGKCPFRKGARFSISTYGIHMDERIFPNPERWSPSRFDRRSLSSREEETAMRTSTIPFGMGSRICPGRFLARQELMIMLSMILQRYAISPADDRSRYPVMRMSLRPNRPVRIVVHRRNP